MIKSVSDSQDEILRWILHLYIPAGHFDADVTFGLGNFYEHIPRPRFCFDLNPRRRGVIRADCRDLPLTSGSIASAVVDPPFLHAPGRNAIMGRRFGGFRSQMELRTFYLDTMTEMYRVLGRRGILVFKCQDVVESRRQQMTHCHVWKFATDLGFTVEDLFILIAKKRIVGYNHQIQQHARKFHSYFWVFRKRKFGSLVSGVQQNKK